MFKIHNHILNTNKNINTKLALLADIHYSEEFDNIIEEKIIKELETNKPDYICIVGDILDTYPFFEKKENVDKVKTFIETIGRITKTFIVFGSHDLEDVKNPIPDFSKSIVKWKSIFKDSKNIYILDNEMYSDETVCITGITLPSKYYNDYPDENKKVLGNLLESLNYKYDGNKYNIMLIHSPRRIFDNIKYLKNIDLVLCGHMHDGGIPKFLKWLPGTRGIIGPHSALFPKYARGTIYKYGLTLLITSGITKIGPSHLKKRKIISKLYNNEMNIITIRGKYE